MGTWVSRKTAPSELATDVRLASSRALNGPFGVTKRGPLQIGTWVRSSGRGLSGTEVHGLSGTIGCLCANRWPAYQKVRLLRASQGSTPLVGGPGGRWLAS